MSHSSVVVTYRPAGPGHLARAARVDLALIPDPEAWLINRLGPLAQCDIAVLPDEQAKQQARLDALACRLTNGMQAILATRRAALDVLAARLDAVAPVGLHQSSFPNPKEENWS
jgi:putative DNA primase/helicase